MNTTMRVVKWLLDEANQTSKEVAHEARVDDSTVSRWARGLTQARPEHMERLQAFRRRLSAQMLIGPPAAVRAEEWEYYCSRSPSYQSTRHHTAERALSGTLAELRAHADPRFNPCDGTGPRSTPLFSLFVFRADLDDQAEAYIFRARHGSTPSYLVLLDRSLDETAAAEALNTEIHGHLLPDMGLTRTSRDLDNANLRAYLEPVLNEHISGIGESNDNR
jgi:hypothetical protein